MRSSTSGSGGSTLASMKDVKLAWESMTALGRPVVPAVNSSAAVSSGSPSGKRDSAGSAASISAS